MSAKAETLGAEVFASLVNDTRSSPSTEDLVSALLGRGAGEDALSVALEVLKILASVGIIIVLTVMNLLSGL